MMEIFLNSSIQDYILKIKKPTWKSVYKHSIHLIELVRLIIKKVGRKPEKPTKSNYRERLSLFHWRSNSGDKWNEAFDKVPFARLNSMPLNRKIE